MTPLPDPSILEELKAFDTPTVLNAVELFDVRPRHEGFLGGEIRACFPELGPVVGYATTATFQSAFPAAGGEAYASIADQVEMFEKEIPQPRVVVFQDIDPVPVGATFGEVMCTVYKAFGCAGLITSGGARDLDQVRKLEFPCWSSAVIASHAWCRIVDIHVPVEIGGVRIAPGDLVHADANGVAIVPIEIAAEVARGCRLLAEAEGELLEYITSGAPDAAGLRAAYGRMKERFAAIPARAREEVRARGR